jgi:CPA2 family monovalent cation:H+ antiporter-2
MIWLALGLASGLPSGLMAGLPFLIAAAAPPPFLVQGAALLVAAAAIAYFCSRVGLVPIVGFLIAGVVIGPFGLNLVHDQATTDAVADVGVILLLFTIGVEFSLERLARITRLIVGGGSLQVTLTSLATMALLVPFGVSWQTGLFTGFLVALSSTAIVLKLLADRGETNSEYGQVALGLLIFQDLAVILMVLLVPTLAGTQGGGPQALAIALAKACGLVLVVLVIARRLMPPLLELVARTCSPELFLLTVMAICFGTAYLTSLAGVSISLGAFLAGLVVSESPFRSQAFTEILPLQILFSATFFVSVGMLLNLSFLVHNLPLVVAAVVLVSIVKIVTTGASVAALGYRVPIAAAAALSLAQVGEFSFVLEHTGRDVGLTPAGLGVTGSQTFIATTVVSMIITPFLTQIGSRLAQKIERHRTTREAEEMTPQPLPPEFPPLDNHVIVAGYGDAARQLVRVLNGSRIPYVITTLSPGGAAEAESEGLPVIRGDAAKQLTLTHAGADRAKVIVIADDDPATAHRIAAVARPLAPNARILVRTRYVTEIEPLSHAGADRVIAEDMESIVQLFSDVLRTYDIAPEEIEGHEDSVRHGGYAVLRQETMPAEPVVVCQLPGGEPGECAPAAAAPASTPLRAASATAASMSPRATPAAPINEPEVSAMNRYPIDTQHRIELKTSVSAARCAHISQIRPVLPSANGCEECLKTGDTWVHLRICMTCGHVGCCDSSKNKHATKHYHRTTHPIVRSLEPGEDWGWCYEDEAML